MKAFLKEYLAQYQKALFQTDPTDDLIKCVDLIIQADKKGKKTIIQGNGASAAIASHCALDFTKQARIRTVCFNDSSLITAYANDYGYENWISHALEDYGDEGDIAILISSSGNSPNIINAARLSKAAGLKLITLSGFSIDNPLKKLGVVNLWFDCRAYNIIECVHMVWLTTIIDMIIGTSEYSVNNKPISKIGQHDI